MAARIVALLLALTLGIATTSSTGIAAHPKSAAHCSPRGYTQSKSQCGKVPYGAFRVGIPQTRLSLQGTGSAGTVGSSVVVVRFPTAHTPLRGVAFRVIVKGTIPTLRSSNGVLYRYIPADNRLIRVAGISHPGIYEILSA